MQDLKNKTFVGIVKDNNDPQKLGRCRVQVINVLEDLPDSDLPWASPWKDLNGNSFVVPDVGKVVSVVFDDGNPYRPEYIYAEHFNINLQKKLNELNGAAYTSMRALMFDHKTQIYSNDSEGLKMDYKFNNINIKDGSIDLNLKDNFSKVNIGSAVAVQQAILGNHFFEWFDEFVKILTCIDEGPFLGAVPTPTLLRCLAKYQTLKHEKFLSHHVNIVDNNYVAKQERVADGTIGDAWISTKSIPGATSESGGENVVTSSEPTNYTPQNGNTTDAPEGVNGDLTTSSDIYGKLSSGAKPADYAKIVPSNNKDVDRILNAMKKRKYVILDRPYEINIVGIRTTYEGGKYTNAFSDWMYLIFKTDNSSNWEIRKYKCSTMPGYFQAVELGTSRGPRIRPAGSKPGAGYGFIGNTKDGKPIDVKLTSIAQNRGGMGILKPAQYLNIYSIKDKNQGIDKWISERCLFSEGRSQACYRDDQPGSTVNFKKEGGKTKTFVGAWGMLLHCGFRRPYASVSVDNWSEGCQVLSSPADLDDLFKYVDKHVEKYGDGFNYTLMYSKDLESDPLS